MVVKVGLVALGRPYARKSRAERGMIVISPAHAGPNVFEK